MKKSKIFASILSVGVIAGGVGLYSQAVKADKPGDIPKVIADNSGGETVNEDYIKKHNISAEDSEKLKNSDIWGQEHVKYIKGN